MACTPNTDYLNTYRFKIKIFQIIAGIIAWPLICGKWYGELQCFDVGDHKRLGRINTINIALVFYNALIIIVNLFNGSFRKLEGVCSFMVTILIFYIGYGLITFVPEVLIILIGVLNVWDLICHETIAQRCRATIAERSSDSPEWETPSSLGSR